MIADSLLRNLPRAGSGQNAALRIPLAFDPCELWEQGIGVDWAGLSNAYFWIDPKNDIAGVYLSQILPFVDVRSFPLFLEFETAVYRSLAALTAA